jgi:hypothetical protein
MGYVPMQGSLSTRGQCRDNRRIWETVVDATDEEFVGPNRLELPVYSEITLSERDARTLLNALGF